jgi:hypothetical protein
MEWIGPVRREGRDGISAALIGAACAWGVVLFVLAVVLPVYTVTSAHAGLQPRHSLVRVYGYRVLAPVSAPLLMAVLVGLLLHLRRISGRRWAGVAGTVVAVIVLLAALVGAVTFAIGIFVVPIGALLLAVTTRDMVKGVAARA